MRELRGVRALKFALIARGCSALLLPSSRSFVELGQRIHTGLRFCRGAIDLCNKGLARRAHVAVSFFASFHFYLNR